MKKNVVVDKRLIGLNGNKVIVLIDICVWHKGENNMTDLKLLEQTLNKLNIRYDELRQKDGTIWLTIDEKTEPKVSKGIEYQSSALFEFNKDESLSEIQFYGA